MKRIGLLVVILVLLAGGYALIQSYPKGDTFTPPSEIQLSEWNQDSIDQIQFAFSQDQVIDLTKIGTEWFVNTYKADQDRVVDLFEAFSTAEISSRVSTNKQNHDRFEVGETATTLKLMQNGEVKQELVLGKSAGGESIYVRLPDDHSVYVLNGLPQHLVSSETAIWRNRTLVSLEPDQIRSVRSEFSRNIYEVRTTDSGWVAESDAGATTTLDEQKTLSWLARFKGLQAIDFLDDEQELGASLGAFTIEEGSLNSLTQAFVYEVFAYSEANKYIITDNEENYYTIQQDQLDLLLPRYTELLDDLTVEAEPVE